MSFRLKISKKSHFLDGSLFFDGLFAAVVTTFAAYGVVNVPCTAVRTYNQCRGYSFVVSSSLGCSRFRLSSFRMCHFCIV